MNDQDRDRDTEMSRQGQASRPGNSANQSGQSGQGGGSSMGRGSTSMGQGSTDMGQGSSDMGGQGSTGDSGAVGGQSWRDRSRQGDQEDTETSGTADQGRQEQTSRS
jgi:hypothetical protein